MAYFICKSVSITKLTLMVDGSMHL